MKLEKGIVEINPLEKKANAEFYAPSSKSITLRAIVCASLGTGKSTLNNFLDCNDSMHLIDAMKEFGARIEKNQNTLVIEGTAGKILVPDKTLFFGDSGAAIRFSIPIASLAGNGKIVLDGSQRLRNRPVGELAKAVDFFGAKIEFFGRHGFPPLAVSGKALGGKRPLDCSESSQYLSALLLSGPYFEKGLEIEFDEKIVSKPYVDLTLSVMKKFHAEAAQKENIFFVSKEKKYQGTDFDIEGDYSSAAFLLAIAAVCGGKVKAMNLKKDSFQGDKEFVSILSRMGCKVVVEDNAVSVECLTELKGIDIDLGNFPDLVPPLSAVALFAQSPTTIANIAHLRLKESDRIMSLKAELEKIGAKVETGTDYIRIFPAEKYSGSLIDSHDDHRIAMAFAIAGLKIPGISIKGKECVSKSFPGFFELINSLQ